MRFAVDGLVMMECLTEGNGKMNAKTLAEMMVDKEIGYKPSDDANWIAKKYIELVNLTENVFEEYNSTGSISTKTCFKVTASIDEDPAKQFKIHKET